MIFALLGAPALLPCPVLPACRHRSRSATMQLQIVTDIDDTIKSSGGVTLAGIPLGGVDTSFQRNAVYPGVFQFATELAYGASGFGRQPAKVAVLTARAEEFRWALEIRQTDKICVGFRRAGEAQGIKGWGIGPVLYGSVQEWICQERKGWRKFENFKKLQAAAERKRQRYLFIGDNGSSEKDLEAAEMIISHSPRALRAVFLHAVSGDQQPAPLPEDHVIEGVPVRYFRTYASAAAKAAQLGLLGNVGARRVLDAVEADMRDDPVNVAVGSANERLLLQELADARASLGMGITLANWRQRLRLPGQRSTSRVRT